MSETGIQRNIFDQARSLAESNARTIAANKQAELEQAVVKAESLRLAEERGQNILALLQQESVGLANQFSSLHIPPNFVGTQFRYDRVTKRRRTLLGGIKETSKVVGNYDDPVMGWLAGEDTHSYYSYEELNVKRQHADNITGMALLLDGTVVKWDNPRPTEDPTFTVGNYSPFELKDFNRYNKEMKPDVDVYHDPVYETGLSYLVGIGAGVLRFAAELDPSIIEQ